MNCIKPKSGVNISGDLTSETYSAIFRFARDAIILESSDQKIIEANPAAEKMIGYSLNELVQMMTWELIAPDSRADTSHHIYDNPQSTENLTFETTIMRKDGSTYPAEISITPVLSENRWLFLSIIRDITILKTTERIQLEAQTNLESIVKERTKELTEANDEILAREVRYRSLVETYLQGIMIIEGPPYSVTFSNPAASVSLGYSSEVIQRLTPEEFVNLIHWTDRTKVLDAYSAVITGKSPTLRFEARFNTKTNDVIWLDLSLAGFETIRETSILMTFIDITKQRQALADLLDNQRDLELYSSFLRHDLKNDLQVVIGNADVIRLTAPDNEIIQQFSEASIAGAERMLGLLNIFGKTDTKRERFIAPILERVSVEAAQSYVKMKCMLHIDPAVLMVRVIGGRLLPIVFRNLISNCAKYAGDEPRVTITAERSGMFIEIRISDNGPGISESIKPRLFGKGASTSGGGLGLYLSRKIVDAYGGSLELVEPTEEQIGATFLVRLAIVSS